MTLVSSKARISLDSINLEMSGHKTGFCMRSHALTIATIPADDCGSARLVSAYD